MPTQADLDNWFTYHPPLPEQIKQYQELRAVGRHFAILIRGEVPAGPEQDRAIEAIRQAVMWANAGIACAQPSPPSSPRLGQTKMTPEGVFVWHDRDCGVSFGDKPHWHLV